MTLQRVRVVAAMGWRDLWHRGVMVGGLLVGLVGMLGPPWVKTRFSHSPEDMGTLLEMCFRACARLGHTAVILLAAGSVDREVRLRTLLAVMIRPISRGEYLLGRVLALVALYGTFLAITLTCGVIVAVACDVTLPNAYGCTALEFLFGGVAWICIAVSLGAITSAATAVTVISLGVAGAWALIRLPSNDSPVLAGIQTLFYYISLINPEPAHSWRWGLALGDMVLYGLLVVMAAAWQYERQDVRLRE